MMAYLEWRVDLVRCLFHRMRNIDPCNSVMHADNISPIVSQQFKQAFPSFLKTSKNQRIVLLFSYVNEMYPVQEEGRRSVVRLRKRQSCLSFPYVCPEPVLVK